MKKLLLGISFFIVCLSFSNAQKKNLFKVNLLSPVVRTANFQYEHGFETSSFQLGLYYTGYKVSGNSFSGFAITPEYRKYLSANKPAPEGFFLAPFLRYQNFTVKTTDSGSENKATLSAFRPGLCVGYQWIFSDIVSLEFFLGPSYSISDLKVDSGSKDDFDYDIFDGFGLRAGMSIGIAF